MALEDERAQHGGARPGSGRKPKEEKHQSAISEAEQRCADRLPIIIGNLEQLADGGVQESEGKYQAAGTIFYEDLVPQGDGRSLKIKKLVFPEKDPEEMVLVEKKIREFGPNVKANEYLANRAMGTPATGDDIKIQEQVDAEIETVVSSLKEGLPQGIWQQVRAVLGIGEDEEESEQD
jgi:hypothetical protein